MKTHETINWPLLEVVCKTRAAMLAPLARCAEKECPDWQWNKDLVPLSEYCYTHAKAHGEQAEVTHG